MDKRIAAMSIRLKRTKSYLRDLKPLKCLVMNCKLRNNEEHMVTTFISILAMPGTVLVVGLLARDLRHLRHNMFQLDIGYLIIWILLKQ